MATQNMVRTHEEKWVSSEKKYPIFDCPRSNQMPWADQMTEIAPYVRKVNIYYKYYAFINLILFNYTDQIRRHPKIYYRGYIIKKRMDQINLFAIQKRF